MHLRPAHLAAFAALLILRVFGVAAADPPSTQPKISAVWLMVGERPPYPVQTPLLSWELYRQAMLIAARDGLGLSTRDESLREWKTTKTPSEAITPSLQARDIRFNSIVREEKVAIWHGSIEGDDWPNNCAALAATAEKLSREDFVAALRAHGWNGTGNIFKADAPVPAEVEGLLGHLDELSQFAALRLTHAAIAADGESAPRLGALVRAYANLSQLAELQLSAENEVYAARALLYAQRMVARDPKSAFALWHRAYAMAMVGLQGAALADLKKAADLKTEEAPKWVVLLEPYCKYQPKQLSDLATADASQTALGTFLAFLTLENSGCQGATMTAAQAALTANPNCLRLVDAMCEETGPGMLNELTERGPQLFSQLLGDRLDRMPQFPTTLVELIHNSRRQGGNPSGRETICQAMIDAGEVGKDSGEPSWSALGRLIQEITFAQIHRRAYLIAVGWGVDASDYGKEVEPIIVDHPYKKLIEAYGLLHGMDSQALQNAESAFSSDQMTASAMRLASLQRNVDQMGIKGGNRVFEAVSRNLDCTSNAVDYVMKAYAGTPPAKLQWMRKLLETSSPDSPSLLAERIQDHWDAQQAASWESDHGDYPSIDLALGQKYLDLKKWSDAERCLKKAVTLSPDYVRYEALAMMYQKQKQDGKWLATLNEFLQQPSYGLEQECVQVEIARHYMVEGDYDKALPFADAAAETGAGSGLLCDAGAQAGNGNWDKAEQLIIDEMNHYSSDPFPWYAWCIRFGHGNRAAATKAVHDYFAIRQDRLTDRQMVEVACIDTLEHTDDQALAMFQKLAEKYPVPVSQLRVALVADEMRNAEVRDSALAKIPAKPKALAPLFHFAAALRDAVKTGTDAEPDDKVINTAAKNAQPVDRIAILYMAGRWHQDRGDNDGATTYYCRCIFGFEGSSWDLLLADDAIRQLGGDPLQLERAAATPGHNISYEP